MGVKLPNDLQAETSDSFTDSCPYSMCSVTDFIKTFKKLIGFSVLLLKRQSLLT
jgi:hypothetical protein